MKKLVVLSGAGISAESGINTFRGSDGLWENHKITDVATPEAWFRNRKLVLDFYNQRRKQLAEVEPNHAHKFFAEMEQHFETVIITQNVDDLHERGGSRSIVHLHGELSKVRSERNPNLIHDIGYSSIQEGDLGTDGAQLRPHIVWFGEDVPLIETAAKICTSADILVIVGTSLNVYPAASLTQFVPKDCKIFVIDPDLADDKQQNDFHIIREKASTGVESLRKLIL